MKKIVSVLLSLTLFTTFITPTLATAENSSFASWISEDESTGESSFVMNGDLHVLRTREYENGDIVFYQYLNYQLIHRATLYYNKRDRLYKTSYVTSETGIGHVTEVIETVEMIDFSALEKLIEKIEVCLDDLNGIMHTAETLLGIVRFQWASPWGGGGIDGVRVSQTIGATIQSTYTIQNHTTTLVGLAGLLTSVLGIPRVISSATATWIISIVGVLTAGGSFFIGHTSVAALKAPVTFNLQNINHASHQNSFVVNRYIVNVQDRPNLEGQTFWEGFGSNNMTTLWRNQLFAMEIQSRMFGHSTWHVHSWTN